jgi:hypothetical protein
MSYQVDRRVIQGGAGMAGEVIADLMGNPDPAELRGYVVIGITAGGFEIASNARDNVAEIVILERVVADLKKLLRGQS